MGGAWKYEKGSYDVAPKERLAINLIRSSPFPDSQTNTCSALITNERREGTLAYNARSTKSSDDLTCSHGRKTRSASAMNIT